MTFGTSKFYGIFLNDNQSSWIKVMLAGKSTSLLFYIIFLFFVSFKYFIIKFLSFGHAIIIVMVLSLRFLKHLISVMANGRFFAKCILWARLPFSKKKCPVTWDQSNKGAKRHILSANT